MIRFTLLAATVLGVAGLPARAATTLHVNNGAPNAADTNPGTAQSPLKTIGAAANRVNPGDTVVVADGTYEEAVYLTRSGRHDPALPNGGYIVFRAANPRRVLIRAKSVYDAAFNVRGGGRWGNMHKIGLRDDKPGTYSGQYPPDAVAFVEVNGFDLRCEGEHTNALSLSWAHHVRVLNNRLHGGGLSGVGVAYCDYVLVEGNDVHDNSRTSHYKGSGINFWRARAFGGGDMGWAGPRIQVRRNRAYDNGHAADRDFNGDKPGLGHTDGNGLILDFGLHNVSALVENNLFFNNGGRGVGITGWRNAVIRNNTLWHNVSDPAMPGDPEFGAYAVGWGDAPEENITSANITFTGNLVVARPGANVFGHYAAPHQGRNEFTLSRNLLWREDGNVGEHAALDAQAIVRDPKLRRPATDPAAADFSLQPDSPAIDALPDGPPTDFANRPRPAGRGFDIGALEHGVPPGE